MPSLPMIKPQPFALHCVLKRWHCSIHQYPISKDYFAIWLCEKLPYIVAHIIPLCFLGSYENWYFGADQTYCISTFSWSKYPLLKKKKDEIVRSWSLWTGTSSWNHCCLFQLFLRLLQEPLQTGRFFFLSLKKIKWCVWIGCWYP